MPKTIPYKMIKTKQANSKKASVEAMAGQTTFQTSSGSNGNAVATLVPPAKVPIIPGGEQEDQQTSTTTSDKDAHMEEES